MVVFLKMVYEQNSPDWEKKGNVEYLSHINRVYLTQMMEKKRYEKRKRNHLYDLKEKKKRS